MEALEFNTCEIGFSSISRAFLGSNSIMVTPGYVGRRLGLGWRYILAQPIFFEVGARALKKNQ
jgi:hypothetical protein